MSDMENANYENVDAKGFFNIADMTYKASDMPTVKIKELKADLTPKSLKINNFDAKLGKSDLQASGWIDNILAYFSPEKTMTGNLKMRSKQFDANEWISEETAEASETPQATEPTESTEIFDRFDFTVDGKFDIINYDEYKLFNTIAVGNMTPNVLTVKEFSTKIGNSDVWVNGVVQNIFDYLFKNETLAGKIKLKSKLLDLNEFMEPATPETSNASEPATTTASDPISVPENIRMDIDADIDKVLYTNMDLREINGKLKVENQEVILDNVQAKALGGRMNFSGAYNTQNIEEPKFNLTYDLKSLDFNQAFNTFNTFQKLAPIGKFIKGNFTSTLTMDGLLGKDMMPNINSLSADGFLETLNGLISGFAPLEKVSNLLNINEFKTMEIDELKTWFTIKDGKVEVKEFPFSWNNIDMKIGGAHGLNQEMDYSIKAKIPRKMLEKSSVTAAANTGLNLLNKEASKLGLNLDAGEFVNVAIKLTGSITDPKVSLNLLGTDGESTTVVEAVKEEITETVEETVEEVKETIEEEVDKQTEDLKKKADAEIAAIMKEAEKSAQTIKNEGRKAAEQIRKTGYEQADKIEKEGAGNPFKKIAAKKAADQMRKGTDKKANLLVKEADERADKVLENARKEAQKVQEKYE